MDNNDDSIIDVDKGDSLGIPDARQIVVIHPGSRNLRVGFASDPFPKTVIHAIARKRTETASVDKKLQRKDSLLVPQLFLDAAKEKKLDDYRRRISGILKNSLRSDGRKRFVEAPESVIEINETKKPHKVPSKAHFDPNSETVVGDELLAMSPDSDYNIHFPIKRGEFEIGAKVGMTLTAVMKDLEDIWTQVITKELEVKNFKDYKAVLIIPSLYQRPVIKHLMTVLLLRMGFGQAFVVQDHVAAAFGAGMSHCCVVDVGDQKTSVSCVEDGISHPSTRLTVDYGGSDVTQVFHYLLKRMNFPYKGCDPENFNDALVLDRLKVDNAHLNLDICGTAIRTFTAMKPGYQLKYDVCLSDECIMAPLTFFHTELFDLTKAGKVRTMDKNEGDPEDPHDEIYLSETSRKYTKQDAQSEENTVNPDEEFSTLHFKRREESGLSLDAVILRSIEQLPSEDLRKRMFANVLLVGQGSKFQGFSDYLKQRLALQIRPHEPDVITNAKDLDGEYTTWKGASIMSTLQTAQDFWISPEEWSKSGQKILREKAPFPWA